MVHELLLHGGLLLDGTGHEPQPGAVLVSDGVIAEILPNDDFLRQRLLSVAEAVDLKGAYLAPGFIDVHTHSDLHIFHCPQAVSAVFQGVTTEVTGNCGFSPFPLQESPRIKYLTSLSSIKTPVTWTDFDGYANAVEQSGTAINLAPLVGHGQIRSTVCGYRAGKATSAQIQKMRTQVDQAMQQGVWGLSSGLEYAPGAFSDVEELAELAKGLCPVESLYTTHMRNEGEFLNEAIKEAIAVAERAGVGLQISHLKTSSRPYWGKIDAALDLIQAAAERGIRVAFDRYPYLAVSTHLAIFLPHELWEGGQDTLLTRLQEDRDYWEDYLKQRIEGRSGFEQVIITDSGGTDLSYQGKTLYNIAESLGKSPESVTLDILIDSKATAWAAIFSMNEEDTQKILAHPSCFLGSDGSIHSPEGPLAALSPHPRSYGTVPRLLGHYVRDKKLITLPEVIRKMTSAPAAHFGIPKRGRIQKGFIADLTVFRLEDVDDPSDFGDPHHPARGIEQVYVGGQAVFLDGKPTGALPGKVLRRSQAG